MNLRTYRRATIKKQILDDISKCTNKAQSKCQGIDSVNDMKTRKRKLSETKEDKSSEPQIKERALCLDTSTINEDLKDQSLATNCVEARKENEELKSRKEKMELQSADETLADDDNQSNNNRSKTIAEDTSENSSMTLQQFTDIVLASEGMSMQKDRKKLSSPEQASSVTPSTPHRKNSLQSSCGGDDEASNSSPTIFSSVLDRKDSTEESTTKQPFCDNSISTNHQKSRNPINGVKIEQFDGGYNNNIVDSTTHNAMVANIMNNKDLTVEVKPINVKPVVLSPRHPNGYNHHFQNHHSRKEFKESEIDSYRNNPWYSKSRQNSLISNGRFHPTHISRPQQRYDSDNSSCSGDIIDSKMSPLPKGRPPSVPKMVEEWLQKMQPPTLDEEDPNDEGSIDVPATNDKSVEICRPQSVPRKHQLILRDPQEMKSTPTNFQPECDSNTVLNLSTKDFPSKSHSSQKHEAFDANHKPGHKDDSDTTDITTTNNGKPTQVYLRPIPTNQMIQKPSPPLPKPQLPAQNKQQILALHEPGMKPRHSDYEQIVILGRHPRKEQYNHTEQHRRYCSPTNNGSRAPINNGNLDYYSKRVSSAPIKVRSGVSSLNQNVNLLHKPRQLISSPNLEITRITSYPKNSPPKTSSQQQMHPKIDRISRNVGDFHLPSPIMQNSKGLGRIFPLDSSNANSESIKARAMRDIQLAHTKDVHGN